MKRGSDDRLAPCGFRLDQLSPRSQRAVMSHRGPLTAVVTAVLGVTLGGLLLWQVYRTKRKKLPSTQKVVDPMEAPGPVDNAPEAAERQSMAPPHVPEAEIKTVERWSAEPPPPVLVLSLDELLAVEPVTVSSEEEWQQMWPLVQKELSVFPVLGLDCEWVTTGGTRSAASFSLIDLTTRTAR